MASALRRSAGSRQSGLGLIKALAAKGRAETGFAFALDNPLLARPGTIRATAIRTAAGCGPGTTTKPSKHAAVKGPAVSGCTTASIPSSLGSRLEVQPVVLIFHLCGSSHST
jgi:hypothetical protein